MTEKGNKLIQNNIFLTYCFNSQNLFILKENGNNYSSMNSPFCCMLCLSNKPLCCSQWSYKLNNNHPNMCQLKDKVYQEFTWFIFFYRWKKQQNLAEQLLLCILSEVTEPAAQSVFHWLP